MAFVVKDRVRQTSSTTGTGAVALSGAVTGFQNFSVIGDGNTTSYTIVDASAGEWEVGVGTYTASGTTLSRDVVLESSNSGSLVNFGAGIKDVFVTYPAEKAVYTDTTNTFTANQIISVSDNANAALRVTQTGTGNALLVEDSGNPDSTPFVIDSAGRVIVGGTTNVSSYGVQINNSNPIDMVRWDAVSTGPTSRFAKSRSGVVGTYSTVASGDTLGTLGWSGDDGTSFVQAASIVTVVDGTPGTNDMPGRLVFNTTADGVSTPTERMRITSDGRVAIGSTGNAGATLSLGKSITGATTAVGTILNGVIQADVTGAFHGYRSSPATQASAFTIPELYHFSVFPQTYGAGSTVTNQYGFNVASTLTGATNNYGFFSNIASGTGRWNFYANGSADNYFNGSLGIGSSSLAGYALRVSKTVTGSTTGIGVRSQTTAASDVTSSLYGFYSDANTSAAAFTLSSLHHFRAVGASPGSGSTITTQYGFHADSGMTGAATNFGFYSNIPSGSARWNFYAAGTASNFFGGNTIISVDDSANAALRVTQAGTGNALLVEDSGNPDSTPFVIDSSGRVINGGTLARSYYLPAFANNYTPSTQILGGDFNSSWAALAQWSTSTTTSGGAFLSLNKSNGVEGTHTIVNSGQRVGGIGFSGSDGVKFLGVADIYGEVDGTPGVNDMPGRLVFATTTGGVNTTEKMRLNNAGALGLGTASLTGYNLNIAKNITGATTAFGVRSGGIVQSDVTGSAQYFYAATNTAASTFTLPELYAYRAAQGTLGAGSTVTSQIGFGVDSSLTGGTNNYGFFSNIAAGTGRWNFYASGTAANYFAGNVGIGIAPSGTYKLEVSGDAAATNFVTTSDRNKKTNIATITNATGKVQALRGVTFDWVADGKASTGLIAQEVELVMPQVVHGDEGSKAVNYGSLVGLLVEAVKEQQTTINQLLARVAQLEGK